MSAPLFHRVEFDMEEVHDLSLDLLQFLEENDSTQESGIAALALTLGRLNAPRVLSTEEQVKFVESVLEYCAMYFVDGRAN